MATCCFLCRHGGTTGAAAVDGKDGTDHKAAYDLYWQLVKTSYPLERLASDPDYDVATKRLLLREIEADYTYDEDFKDSVVNACVGGRGAAVLVGVVAVPVV